MPFMKNNTAQIKLAMETFMFLLKTLHDLERSSIGSVDKYTLQPYGTINQHDVLVARVRKEDQLITKLGGRLDKVHWILKDIDGTTIGGAVNLKKISEDCVAFDWCWLK